MEEDLKQHREEITKLHEQVTDLRLAMAAKSGGQKATTAWAAIVAALIAAWLGVTSLWHIPHLVRSTAMGQAAIDSAVALESAKKDAVEIDAIKRKYAGNLVVRLQAVESKSEVTLTKAPLDQGFGLVTLPEGKKGTRWFLLVE